MQFLKALSKATGTAAANRALHTIALLFLLVSLAMMPPLEGAPFFLFSSPGPSRGHSPPKIVAEVFLLIIEQYHEQPDAAHLVHRAICGMESLLREEGKAYTRPAIQWKRIGGDRMKLVHLVSSLFDYYRRTARVSPQKLEYAAIQGMLDSLDENSAYMTAAEAREDIEGEAVGLGLRVGLENGMLTALPADEGSPVHRAGIRAGDRILRIEGRPTKDMDLREIISRIQGPRGTAVTLTALREGWEQPKDFTVIRDAVRTRSVEYRLLERGIGYLSIKQFQRNTARDVEEALQHFRSSEGELKGLVLDLRDNPGGLIREAVEVASKFIPSGIIVYLKERAEDTGQRYTGRRPGVRLPCHDVVPMVVLVNDETASASEIVAGALQDYRRSVIIGRNTYGKVSVQTLFPLSNGATLSLTTGRDYLPSGKLIRRGIRPEVWRWRKGREGMFPFVLPSMR